MTIRRLLTILAILTLATPALAGGRGDLRLRDRRIPDPVPEVTPADDTGSGDPGLDPAGDAVVDAGLDPTTDPGAGDEATDDGRSCPPRALVAVARFLELDESQRETWRGLLEQRRAAAEPLREQLAAARRELADLLGQGGADPAEVGELTLEIHRLRSALREVKETYAQGFESMLDDEQLAKLEFIRRAARVQPLVPAFRRAGLVGPPERRRR